MGGVGVGVGVAGCAGWVGVVGESWGGDMVLQRAARFRSRSKEIAWRKD